MTPYSDDIKKCIEVMNRGGLILYPTDTIWGIGCDATNAEAVKKVYELKQRADNKAMLALMGDDVLIDRYVHDIPEIAYDLIGLATKPLTIIYEDAYNLAENLLGENRSIGIRITREPFSQALCKRFARPVVSTSANISGQPSPGCFADVAQEIKDGVDYIVNYRQDDTSRRKASSIIMLGKDCQVKVIRE